MARNKYQDRNEVGKFDPSEVYKEVKGDGRTEIFGAGPISSNTGFGGSRELSIGLDPDFEFLRQESSLNSSRYRQR